MHILHSLMFPAQDCPPRWGRGLEQDLRRVWIPPLHFAVQSDQGVQADQFPFTGGSGYTLKNVLYICVLIHCTVHLVYKILSLSRNIVNQKNNTHHRNNVMNTVIWQKTKILLQIYCRSLDLHIFLWVCFFVSMRHEIRSTKLLLQFYFVNHFRKTKKLFSNNSWIPT